MSKRRRRRRVELQTRTIPGEQISILLEVDYIVARAEARDTRVVTLGPLVFFSHSTGDAWVLDPADSLALCLARDGTPLPVTITETAEQFAIEWSGSFQIEGETMTFTDAAGGSRAVYGYPTEAIAQAIRRVSS
jgi:hypothetical protein